MSNNKLAQVFHFDLQGKREAKYDFLNNNSIASIDWNTLEPNEPNFFFVKKNNEGMETYELGFKVDELFVVNNSGVSTDRDSLFLDDDKIKLINRIKYLLEENYSTEFKKEYNVEDSSGYPLLKRILNKKFEVKHILDYQYRPFDFKKIYFDDTIISRPAKEVTKLIVNKQNLLLIVPRQVNDDFHHVFTSNIICDSNITSSSRLLGAGKLFPLYLYPETTGQLVIGQSAERTPNLNTEIVNKIAEGLGLKFTNEKETTEGTFAPIDILDYIYAVLHSPTYREKYKEFLKIDFPRVPYPKSLQGFRTLGAIGAQLRQIHLLESPVVEEYITQYPEDGNNVVVKPIYKDGKVYINETQYFDNVPEVAWNFYIGGYQPAQKWLKDRKDRKLEFDDILHYQKIIVALTETDRLMKEIDKLEFE